MNESLKTAALRICRPADPVLLEEPPLVENDLGKNCVCPACGSLDTRNGTCDACSCTFSAPPQSLSKGILRRLGESDRQRRLFLSVK